MSHSVSPPHHPHKVFSSKNAEKLDTGFRRFLYHPERLAERFVKPGDKVLDFGCGPGFFTREFAKRVGEGGVVYSVDLQEEMLEILKKKMAAEGLLSRIRPHRCEKDSIHLPAELKGTFDAAFTIFVVHEVPNPAHLFQEIADLLKTGGTFFYSEPPFLVPRRDFQSKVTLAREKGFRHVDTFFYFVNRAAVLKKM